MDDRATAGVGEGVEAREAASLHRRITDNLRRVIHARYTARMDDSRYPAGPFALDDRPTPDKRRTWIDAIDFSGVSCS